MDMNNLQTLSQNLTLWGTQIGLKVLGAVALWIIGRRLIHFGVDLMTRGLRMHSWLLYVGRLQLDPSTRFHVLSGLNVFMAFAVAAVCGPRSFWKTTPS